MSESRVEEVDRANVDRSVVAAAEIEAAEIARAPWRIFASRPVLAVLGVAVLGYGLSFAPPPWNRLALLGERPAPSEQDRAAQERAERERASSGSALSAADRPAEEHVGEVELSGESRALPGMAAPEGPAAAPTAAVPLFGGQRESDEPEGHDKPPVSLLLPRPDVLDHFFAALLRTERKAPGAVTRIAHFGDSIVVSDYVSGTLRRRLQDTFGDAGHGYMLIANPWPAYFHNDVFRFATSGFRVSRIVGPTTEDGFYGLGGVTFRASDGVVAEFGTAEKGDHGARASRFVVSYLQSPGAGHLLLRADGGETVDVDTNGPKQVARHELRLSDGPHRIEMKVRGGETRTFGVVLERDGPGVVLDALGVQGARIRFLDKQDDAHFAEELKWRDPALVVFQFGANESGDGYAYPMDQYLATMKAVITQSQAALPHASCLIVGAMDRARVEEGVTTSMRIIQLIIAEQRRAAEQLGCAYFDTYESMGGWGSMPAWVKRGLGQADMTHPTGMGAERIAGWIYGALMQQYDVYRRSH
ncbi:MAG TPA: GDSL-type esterase/lipase family protein [Polyangiaceae bacterium]|nr:GDSL-type esterase/lipase family protein [Polyangiaceae bacterium]